MRVRAIQFGGFCECGAGNDTPSRPGVEYTTDPDDEFVGEFICAECAMRIWAKLISAADRAIRRTKRGDVYRNDKWEKKS